MKARLFAVTLVFTLGTRRLSPNRQVANRHCEVRRDWRFW
jgi:hypothetical protein